MSVKTTDLHQALPEEQKSWPVFSFSQMQTFDRCGFLWHMQYQLNYAPEHKALAMNIGTMVHEALADYYILKRDSGPYYTADIWVSERLAFWANHWMNSDDPNGLIACGRATFVLDRYMMEVEKADYGHTIVDVEKHFLLPLKTPKGRNFLLQGYIDLITTDRQGHYWLWDHKTGAKAWTPMEVMMDPQFPLYAVALDQEGIDVFGIIVNQIVTYDYKDNSKVTNLQLLKREETHRSTVELMTIARTMFHRADLLIDAMESEEVPFRSLTKDCGRYCAFKEPCLLSMKGISVEIVLQDSFKSKEERKADSTNNISIKGFQV